MNDQAGGVHVVKVPDIGEGIAEVELMAWHVEAGSDVTADQAVADVMTDKATVEIPTPRAGRVVRRCFAEGQICPVGKVLIEIDTSGQAGDVAGVVAAPVGGPGKAAVAPSVPSAPVIPGRMAGIRRSTSAARRSS